MQRNSLRYFVAIAEQGSLRAAADVLHISQSALSRQIINMEEELGAPLLERQPRGIVLTSAGQIFLRYARDGMAQYDLVKSELSALQGLHRGTVCVAAPEAFSNLLLPNCMRNFRAQYPRVQIVVRIATTRGVVADVRDGVADFGIAYSPELDHEMQIGFRSNEEMVAIMNPRHPLAQRESLALSELVDTPLALPIPQSATGEMIFRTARKRGIKLRAAVESNSVHIRLWMAVNSDVVALLARISAADVLKSGDAVAVPLRERALNSGNLCMFSLPRRRLSAAATAFQALISRELQEMLPQ